MKNQLSIRLNGEPIGILEQLSNGKMKFTYSDHAKQMISMHMPIREEPYNEIQTEAYFGGLLPESEAAKMVLGKRYGISSHNNFALLKAIGYDCAGAISCHSLNEPVEIHHSFPLTAKIISDEELYQHIKDLPKKPLFMDVDGLRLSLAGVQDKAAVCVLDNKIALAENGCPTTHILKPSTQLLHGIAENEYFCLRIAKRLGLPIPNIELKQIKDISFLLIERYDRRIHHAEVERIHQEDFCQALGIVTPRKYQNEGGPGFIDCFELLTNTAQPAIDRNLLASALVFNYLIGNMDAHAKNFSLLHYAQQNIRLSPFYDMVCTRVYSHLTQKMAMKIGNKYSADEVFPRHWEQLCKNINYRYITLKKLIHQHAESILKYAQEEKKFLMDKNIDNDIINQIIIFLEKNIEVTLKRFRD